MQLTWTKIKFCLILCCLISSCCLHAQTISAKAFELMPSARDSSGLPGDNKARLLKAEPCSIVQAAAAKVTAFAQTTIFNAALNRINRSFSSDGKEHSIAFGKDINGDFISSEISVGEAKSGIVPGVDNGLADLHNHPRNYPPDAGDLYGLISFNKKQSSYDMRFIVTQNQTIYALVITDPEQASLFTIKYPSTPPACPGCSPTFPEAIVDEFRELKYVYGLTDEMAMAFILEKYNAGVALLKMDGSGNFKKLKTTSIQNPPPFHKLHHVFTQFYTYPDGPALGR